MHKLNVKTPSGPYPIFISKDDLKDTALQIKKRLNEPVLYVITSNPLKKRFKGLIERNFRNHFRVEWISIPDGEKYKTLSTCEKISIQLSKKGANRRSHLLALGGGVVGDITGFVAATYMRGIEFFQMPTSLLAQVDSSVGGKTGVDLTTGKNLVGAFHQPKCVFIHTQFLKSLPKRELRCGLAEVIKYGYIWDPKFLNFLKSNHKKILKLDDSILMQVIKRCCSIKATVVAKDEKEANLRAILNFGHTLGHALESYQEFKGLKHGEAVALGMIFAAKLSHHLKVSKQDLSEDMINLLKTYQLPTAIPKYPANPLAKMIMKDKKSTGSKIRFILLENVGKVKTVNLSEKNVRSCLSTLIQ